MKLFGRQLNKKGFVEIPVLIVGALAAIIVLSILPSFGTLNTGSAISMLEGQGYVVFAAGEYASMDAKLDALKVTTDQTVHVEEHIHNEAVWFGFSGDQSGNDWGNRTSLVPYVATSGNNAWGGATATDYAKLLGTADTPINPGHDQYDPHQILIESNSSATIYRCRFIWGTGTVADAITANQYSEFMYLKPIADKSRKIIEVIVPKIDMDTQLWLNIWNATNDATMDVFIGIHEYE